jgi:hypothetical protein
VTIPDYVAIGILILLALLALPRLLREAYQSKLIPPASRSASNHIPTVTASPIPTARRANICCFEDMAFFSKRARRVPEEEAGFCDGCHGAVTKSHIQWFSNFDFVSCLAQNIRPKQLRQLGDVHADSCK